MELIYTNSSGQSVSLRQTKPFFITKIDGMGAVRQSINTFRAPEMDGAFFVSSSVDMRNITIDGQILASKTQEARTLRRQLLQTFTPKQRGILSCQDKQIGCIVEEAAFSVSLSEKSPAFFISLLCPSPFFEAAEERQEELASWKSAFLFPLEIPESGIELGVRQPSQILEIINEGDVSCGCEIIFKALGNSVANPELRKLETGELMRILTALQIGQEAHIYTHFANKKVSLLGGGNITNIINLIDTDSTFFQLDEGKNTLRFAADTNIDQLEVTLKFRPQFLSI